MLARYVPLPASGRYVVVGVDATNIARPESPTAKDRTFLYVHNLPKCSAPVTSGWSFSTLVALPETPRRWTYILDNLRIPSAETAGNVAAAQLAALVPWVSLRVLVTADRYYGRATFVQATAKVDGDKLLRIPACCTIRLPLERDSAGHPRKMGRASNATIPAPMASRPKHGLVGVTRVSPFG